VNPWILPDITIRLTAGEIRAFWRHRITEIGPRHVTLRSEDNGTIEQVENDWVIAMTGYTPDPRLLQGLGVTVDPDTGIPAHDPATLETDVPGVFIAGVGVEDLGAVAAVHPAHGLHLAGQPSAGDVIPGDLGAQHLDGDELVALAHGLVDDPHAPLADAATDPVRTDTLRQSFVLRRSGRHRHPRTSPRTPVSPDQIWRRRTAAELQWGPAAKGRRSAITITLLSRKMGTKRPRRPRCSGSAALDCFSAVLPHDYDGRGTVVVPARLGPD
jgi:hypothetical protein